MELLEKMSDMLLLLALLLTTTSAYNLTCHCLDGAQCHTNGYCERGCEKGWFGPGCQVGNVAVGKTAKQSSTFYKYGYNYTAGLAVDGKMLRFDDFYCSSTNGSHEISAAWWYVVLDVTKSYVITNITIVNLEYGARYFLTNFKILYSNETDGDPDPLSSSWQQCVEEKDIVFWPTTYKCQSNAIAKRVAVYLTREQAYNPESILTLCEVLIYGYQHHVCPSGYTGPGCLLRSCDECDLHMGQCSGDYGSCRYSVCPRRSLLPPQCWITLSDFSLAEIRTTATCYKMFYSVDLPEDEPNIAASLAQLEVRASNGQLVVNETIPLRGGDSTTFNYSSATADTSYVVSVKPLYCDISNMSCFYASSSDVFNISTGRREYILSHNSSCIFVNVTSTTPGCEQATEIQVTCQAKDINIFIRNSSSFEICGIKNDQGYNCFIRTIVNADIIERQSVYIVLVSSRAPENDSHVLAGSVGGSSAIIVVVVAILAFVYCRRQRCAKSPALVVSEYENVKSHLSAGSVDETKLPPSCNEQRDSPYESLHMASGLQTTGDYTSLSTQPEGQCASSA